MRNWQVHRHKPVVWFENHDLGVVSERRRIATLAELAGSTVRSKMIGTVVRVGVAKVKGKTGPVDSIVFDVPEGDAILF